MARHDSHVSHHRSLHSGHPVKCVLSLELFVFLTSCSRCYSRWSFIGHSLQCLRNHNLAPDDVRRNRHGRAHLLRHRGSICSPWWLVGTNILESAAAG